MQREAHHEDLSSTTSCGDTLSVHNAIFGIVLILNFEPDRIRVVLENPLLEWVSMSAVFYWISLPVISFLQIIAPYGLAMIDQVFVVCFRLEALS